MATTWRRLALLLHRTRKARPQTRSSRSTGATVTRRSTAAVTCTPVVAYTSSSLTTLTHCGAPRLSTTEYSTRNRFLMILVQLEFSYLFPRTRARASWEVPSLYCAMLSNIVMNFLFNQTVFLVSNLKVSFNQPVPRSV